MASDDVYDELGACNEELYDDVTSVTPGFNGHIPNHQPPPPVSRPQPQQRFTGQQVNTLPPSQPRGPPIPTRAPTTAISNTLPPLKDKKKGKGKKDTRSPAKQAPPPPSSGGGGGGIDMGEILRRRQKMNTSKFDDLEKNKKEDNEEGKPLAPWQMEKRRPGNRSSIIEKKNETEEDDVPEFIKKRRSMSFKDHDPNPPGDTDSPQPPPPVAHKPPVIPIKEEGGTDQKPHPLPAAKPKPSQKPSFKQTSNSPPLAPKPKPTPPSRKDSLQNETQSTTGLNKDSKPPVPVPPKPGTKSPDTSPQLVQRSENNAPTTSFKPSPPTPTKRTVTPTDDGGSLIKPSLLKKSNNSPPLQHPFKPAPKPAERLPPKPFTGAAHPPPTNPPTSDESNLPKPPEPIPMSKPPAPIPTFKPPAPVPTSKPPAPVPTSKPPAPIPTSKPPAPIPTSKPPAPIPTFKPPAPVPPIQSQGESTPSAPSVLKYRRLPLPAVDVRNPPALPDRLKKPKLPPIPTKPAPLLPTESQDIIEEDIYDDTVATIGSDGGLGDGVPDEIPEDIYDDTIGATGAPSDILIMEEQDEEMYDDVSVVTKQPQQPPSLPSRPPPNIPNISIPSDPAPPVPPSMVRSPPPPTISVPPIPTEDEQEEYEVPGELQQQMHSSPSTGNIPRDISQHSGLGDVPPVPSPRGSLPPPPSPHTTPSPRGSPTMSRKNLTKEEKRLLKEEEKRAREQKKLDILKEREKKKRDELRAKNRQKSLKAFKDYKLPPVLNPLFSVEILLDRKAAKDHVAVNIGERVSVILITHEKLAKGKYMIEKEDGTIGLVDERITERTVYQTTTVEETNTGYAEDGEDLYEALETDNPPPVSRPPPLGSHPPPVSSNPPPPIPTEDDESQDVYECL